MKWYIIRHGETDYNKKGIVQGSGIDAPLNEKGRLQAEAFYNENKDVKFDKLYISELQRTHQSVAKFRDSLPTHILPGLNEISWGEKEGSKITFEPNSCFKVMVEEWQNGNLDYSLKDGESPLQVAKRQKTAIESIKNGGGENILICMHGRAMRVFLSLLLETDLELMDKYEHSNLCLYVVEWDDSKFELIVRNRSIDI